MSDPVTVAITVDDQRGSRDLILETLPEASVGSVLDVIGLDGTWNVDGRTLQRGDSLAASGIVSGAVLRSGPSDQGPESRYEFRLADDSRTWPLPEGSHQIGRILGSITVDDPTVSRLHAEVLVNAHSVVVRDLGSSNGTLVNGEPAEGMLEVPLGATVQVGDIAFVLAERKTSDASLEVRDDCSVAFNRPGRFRTPLPDGNIRLPERHTAPERPAFPWATLVSPVAVALIALFVFRRPEMLLLSVVGPIAAVAQYVTQRRRAAARARQADETYRSSSGAYEAALDTAVEAERGWRLNNDPDLPVVIDIATLPRRRLWERRPDHDDYLTVRVGTADLPGSVRVEGSTDTAAPIIADAPVVVSLKGAVTGLAGPLDAGRSLLRAVLIRLATLHSPNDLRIVLLAPEDDGSAWSWIRWLPHVFAPTGEWAIGNNRETADQRLAELDELVKIRAEVMDDASGRVTPDILVVVDGAARLRTNDSFLHLLQAGPALGIHVLALDADASRLPAESSQQIVTDGTTGRLDFAEAQPIDRIDLEQLDPAAAEEAARKMLPIVLTGSDDAGLPRSIRLTDLLGDVTSGGIRQRWAAGRPTTKATIGVASTGTFSVDLRKDGPHTLIAGTTGSGKTELLQSLLASLAAANPPKALGFLLVDYKGGGDYADLVALPHTLGMVSNLDEALTQRAIHTLKAEVDRRQWELRELRQSGVISEANVRKAWEEAPDEAERRHLGRLVIVVDEFALFARNLPNFVEGLVQLTEQGRSLGMHLILSVQRPAGVVTGAIRANTGLRIVLRTERGESIEVLEDPQADMISRGTPGRGYVRIGDPPRLVEFQAARVGGRRADESVNHEIQARTVSWREIGRVRGFGAGDKVTSVSTDLAMLVENITEAATDESIPPRPWPDPLPPAIDLDDARLATGDGGGPGWALADRPGERDIELRQTDVVYDLEDKANLAVIGTSRSGRSTTLLTLATTLARMFDPSAVQFVGLDFAGGDLRVLEALPHIGGVAVNDPDRFERYVERVVEEVSRRRQNRSASDPELVVLIDGWERLAARYELGSEIDRQIQSILRDGPSVGVRVIAAGSEALMSVRLASLFRDRLMLDLNDRNRYFEVGINPKQIPDELPPGRGFWAADGSQIQVATAENGWQHAVAEAAARWGSVEPDRLPITVDALPASVTFDEAFAMPALSTESAPMSVCVGVGGDRLGRIRAPLDGGFVVGGRRGSGKTTALRWIAEDLIRREVNVAVVAGRRADEWSDVAQRPEVLGVYDRHAQSTSFVGDLEAAEGPVVILIDDAAVLARQARPNTTSLLGVARVFVEARGEDRSAVIVSGDIDDLTAAPREAIGLAIDSASGLLFSPTSLELRSMGVRNPSERLTEPASLGRGVVLQPGSTVVVQVPIEG